MVIKYQRIATANEKDSYLLKQFIKLFFQAAFVLSPILHFSVSSNFLLFILHSQTLETRQNPQKKKYER